MKVLAAAALLHAAASQGAPTATGARAGAAGGEAALVMVVRSPTVVVKERTAAPASAVEPALHPGLAVDKAVAAATVVMFPTAASGIAEIEGETIDGIARLAAREGCELLLWARASDPSLMAEAQRRVAELRTRVLAAGPIHSNQVVTRITTRQGAAGVDVVVSALRQAPGPAVNAAPAAAAALQRGESGKRQIREAVQAAQPAIAECSRMVMARRGLSRADGVLGFTVAPGGRVVSVRTGKGDLAGTFVEECLAKASGAWRFPGGEAEYVAEVPITVLEGAPR